MNSQFYQLNKFLLLEWIHFDQSEPIQYGPTTDKWSRIKNKVSGEYQILNQDSALNTNNVRDHSSVKLDSNNWAYLDTSPGVNYLQQNPSVFNYTTLDVNNQDINLNGVYNQLISFDSFPKIINYDTVKIHILQGYTFDDIDGNIFEIGFPTNNGKILWVSTATYLRGDTWENLAPRPKNVNGKYYNRYIEFLVPSMKYLVQDALFGISNPLTKIDPITSGYNTLRKEQPFLFNFYSILKTQIKTIGSYNYSFFATRLDTQVSINQEDEQSAFACILQESTSGDYFEYFATWEGFLISDYINFLQNSGSNWIIQHDIQVTEQIDNLFLEVQNFIDLQLDNFDKVKFFRPVLVNAANAYSYSIDYQCKLIDVDKGKTISRSTSFTSTNAKKYGPELLKIDLSRNPAKVLKVYNKLSSPLQLTLPAASPNQGAQQIIVPQFYNNNLIVIDSQVYFLNKDGSFSTSSTDGTKTLWPQDQLQIEIDPFDNWLYFKIYQKLNGAPVELDLSGPNSYIVYFSDTYQFNENASSVTSKTRGELLFKIPRNRSVDLVKLLEGRFWIISSYNGESTRIYSGFWKTSDTTFDVKKSQIQSGVNDPVSLGGTVTSTSASTITAGTSTIEPITTGITVKDINPKNS